MAVEMVVLAPVLVAFVMLVIAFSRFVAVQGEVESAAREAARAASIQRTAGEAAAAAGAAATATLPAGTSCSAVSLGGAFVAGGVVTVSLDCRVRYDDLGLPGLPGSAAVTGRSAAPLETYRRVG